MMPKGEKTTLSEPAVDLTTCDREAIHLIGSIQPIGFLVAISSDWNIVRASANAPQHLGIAVEELLGKPFREVICADAVHTIRNQLSSLRGGDVVERAFGVQLQDGQARFDLAVHMAGPNIVIEAEPSEPLGAYNAAAVVRAMLGRLQERKGLAEFTREAARLVQALTGFDRVMIYRFHPDHSGEVIAERARPGLEPYLGLRYPASDIPRQARALMVRNPVRVLCDIGAEPVPVIPARNPAGELLDLSMSTLRTPSPIHVEYLRNMGVHATLTVSLVREGQLWGLIACHHMAARHIGFERRTTIELFSQMLSLLIEGREREEIAAYEERTRHLHNQLMAAVVEGGSAGESIAGLADRMAEIVPCEGVAVFIDGKVTLRGQTPTQDEITVLLRFLDRNAASRVFSTEEIASIYPGARDFTERAAGLLAIPISRAPRDYLVFFRREVARSVTWAGDPTKPVEVGPNGVRLTPRKSFEAWREVVRGHCAPWTEAELRAAEALRTTLLEVVLRLTGLAEHERGLARQKQELLIAELNHRVRNILGLIRGLVAQSRIGARDVNGFATVLGDRIQALASAHDQITAQNWSPGSLAALVTTEAGAYLGARADSIRVGGPAVLLQPPAFSTLALVIHELMTNAAKYGALSGRHGHVRVDWASDPAGNLNLTWQEEGGPAVTAPARRGFGSTIIERSIPHELGGEAAVEFALSGLRARFVIPARHVLVDDRPAAQVAPPPRNAEPARLAGPVLLVEDNMVIALEAEEMLMKLGAERVYVAGSVGEALRSIEMETPGFAILDVHLGNETSYPVAARLRSLGVPHIFATGYGNGVGFPPEHRATLTVSKPYTADSIARAVSAAQA